MIVDVAQLLYFKVVLGMTDRSNGLSERHAAPDIVDHQEETRVVQDVDYVHLVVLIKLEKLHHFELQSDLLLRLLIDPFHVHMVVLFILVVDLIDVGEDLIVIMVEQLLDDDIDDWQ
jgi:hypothetical protein